MRPSGDLAAADLGDDHDGRPGRPILPEVRPARRWSLVGRWSPEPVKGLGAIRGRVLHGHEQRLPVRREAWPAKLGANRHAIEQLRRTAPLALGLQAVKAVGSAGPRPVVALIGGDPQPAFIVHAGIIGAGEPAIVRGVRIPQSIDPAARVARIAASYQDLPGEALISVVAAIGGELDDVTEQVFGTRVCLIDLVGFPLIVVGENDVDLPLDVFG